jgi:hypothetical protein
MPGVAERFWSKADREHDCRVWLGAHHPNLRSAADRASWDTSGLKMQVRGLRPVTRAANA